MLNSGLVLLSPSVCKYTVHGHCANKNPGPCACTFVKSKKQIGVSLNRVLFHISYQNHDF